MEHILTSSYKHFLIDVGAMFCFESTHSAGINFFRLEEMKNYADNYFEGITNLFPKLLIIGNLLSLGDDFGFNTTKGTTKNFVMFFHDEDPEIYLINEPTFHDFED